MPRAKNSVASRRRRKKVLRAARGYRGGRSKLFRTADDAVNRGLAYAYRDRKQKKRVFRGLWIARINAAARFQGISYSQFMAGLKRARVETNRKVLADLAVTDPDAFAKVVETAKAQAPQGT